MRKMCLVSLLSVLALAGSGCLMVIGGAGFGSTRLSKHQRIVEIDDQLYIVDLDENTVKRLDSVETVDGARVKVQTTIHED